MNVNNLSIESLTGNSLSIKQIENIPDCSIIEACKVKENDVIFTNNGNSKGIQAIMLVKKVNIGTAHPLITEFEGVILADLDNTTPLTNNKFGLRHHTKVGVVRGLPV